MNIRVESPFPQWALPRVWQWIEATPWIRDDYAPRTIEDFIRGWLAGQNENSTTWAVYRDDDIGGVIQAVRQSPMVAAVHILFAKRFWGHDTTVPALRLVLDGLFQTYSKIETFCFADSRQILHLARTLGGVKEGVLRQHTVRRGKPVDLVLMGLTREDYRNGLGSSNSAGDRSRSGRGSGRGTEQHEGRADERAERNVGQLGLEPDAALEPSLSQS